MRDFPRAGLRYDVFLHGKARSSSMWKVDSGIFICRVASKEKKKQIKTKKSHTFVESCKSVNTFRKAMSSFVNVLDPLSVHGRVLLPTFADLWSCRCSQKTRSLERLIQVPTFTIFW